MGERRELQHRTETPSLFWWCATLLASVILGSWFFVGLFSRYGEEQEREALLVIASTAATSIDAGLVIALQGGSADLGTTTLRLVRERLQRIRSAIPDSRFVYLVALRNSEVIFLADAEQLDSTDYSPPGEVYKEASRVMRDVFVTKRPAVEGPLSDRWGEWVSGLAPLLDPRSGEVLAVFGIDVNAATWKAGVAHYRWFGIAVSGGFSVGIFFFSYLAYRQYRLREKLAVANRIVEEAQAIAHVGSWSYDVQNRKVTWSTEHYRIYGVDPATFNPSYEALLARIHRDDRASFEEEYAKSIANHIPFEFQKRIVMDDGSIKFVRDDGRTYYDSKGRPTLSMGTVQDITDQKNAEERILFSNTLLTTQMETSPDAILVVDENGHIISYNHRFADMWQVPLELLRGQDDAPVLSAVMSATRDPERFLERVRHLYRHPEEAGHDELETKDGRFIDRHTAALRTPVGLHLGRVWFFRDITEPKLAAEKVRASEERLRIVFSSVNDGIFVTDMKTGKFIEINPSGCAMFGYDREELIGCSIVDLSSGVPPYTQEAAIETIKKARSDGPQTFEWQSKAKGGRLFWTEIAIRCTTFGDVDVVLATVRDISLRKQAEARILRMARHDELTGLANRGVFVEALEQAIARVKRGSKSFAVLYLDLDRFKDVNDTLGHPVGDELLKLVSARLLSKARETDTVARFGGDEFAVIVADVDEPIDAAAQADALIKTISDPFSIQGNDIHIGASLGISVFGPDEPDAETLLSHADVALYRAKSEGRGTYRFFTDSMDAEVRTRVSVTEELREAIASGQLFLMYQPQVEIETGVIIGLEALARWRHPERGVLGPDVFIPVAEKSGLIASLGRWVLLEGCRQTKAWADAGVPTVNVAVNFSGIQFKRAIELERDITSALTETGLPAQKLELELTETVLMEASREHNDALLRLRQSGVRIAIDDFGTGFSSLDYLRRFPVDRIKIAQTFVEQIATVPGSAAIVRATIGLARELGIAVIAEGVETEQQLVLLNDWGCREAQGYYFARPLSPEDVLPLLRCGRILRTGAVRTRTAA